MVGVFVSKNGRLSNLNMKNFHPPPKQDLKLAPWGAITFVMGLYQLHVSFFYVTPFLIFGLKSVFGLNQNIISSAPPVNVGCRGSQERIVFRASGACI